MCAGQCTHELCQQAAQGFRKIKGETGFGRQWRFNTTKLRLKGGKFCHFSGKGWQCGMIIQWLNDFLQSNNVPVHQNVKTAVWAADNFIGFLHETKKRGLFLTQQEAEQIQAVGFLFLSTYLCLHVQFKRFCVYRLYNLRPKFHMLTHLIDDCQLLKNPCFPEGKLEKLAVINQMRQHVKLWTQVIKSVHTKTFELHMETEVCGQKQKAHCLNLLCFLLCQKEPPFLGFVQEANEVVGCPNGRFHILVNRKRCCFVGKSFSH